MKLMDAIVGCVITIILIGLGFGVSSSHPGQFTAAALEVPQLIALARNTAQSDDGATLYIVDSGTSWTAKLYAGRPENGAQVGTLVKSATLSGSLVANGLSTYGIFFGSAGTIVGVQSWDGTSQLTSESGCPTTGVPLILSLGSKSKALTISCD